MVGLTTSTMTGSVIFTESFKSKDNESVIFQLYRQVKRSLPWLNFDNRKLIDQTDENKSRYINNLQLRENYQAPKYPIVLCHGLSGFDRLIVVPSFNLITRLVTGEGLTDFSAIEEKGGLSLEYWFGIKEALEAKGSKVLVAKVPGFGSIEERSEVLNKFITKKCANLILESEDEVYNVHHESTNFSESFSNFKDKNEKIKINLIAHSMGGLDCRYLISELEKKNYQVVSLTTVTTPHNGSEMADYCIDLAKKFPTEIKLPPSIYQLSTSYLKQFNEKIKNDPNVLYMSYGACFQPKWYNIFFGSWSIINQISGDNDGMVSVSSSKWGIYLGTLNNVDHLDLINWKNVFRSVSTSIYSDAGSNESIDTLALYLDIADNLAKRGF